MQSKLPLSKPLLLMIIGLIIGASLGLGSGYAVFYPNMVKQRNKSLDERVSSISANITHLGKILDNYNQSMITVGESLEEILTLADVVQQLSTRVTAVESGQVTLNTELDDLEETLSHLDTQFTDLGDSWESTKTSFQDLETAYYATNSELNDIQILIHENDGIRIFTRYMANPSEGFKQTISDELYEVLILSNSNFVEWVEPYTEDVAKVVLKQELESLIGSLVWNPTENIVVGEDSHQVNLETFFVFNFNPAGFTVKHIHLEVESVINVETGEISHLEVTLMEIV